jgi:hypothetical protein
MNDLPDGPHRHAERGEEGAPVDAAPGPGPDPDPGATDAAEDPDTARGTLTGGPTGFMESGEQERTSERAQWGDEAYGATAE